LIAPTTRHSYGESAFAGVNVASGRTAARFYADVASGLRMEFPRPAGPVAGAKPKNENSGR